MKRTRSPSTTSKVSVTVQPVTKKACLGALLRSCFDALRRPYSPDTFELRHDATVEGRESHGQPEFQTEKTSHIDLDETTVPTNDASRKKGPIVIDLTEDDDDVPYDDVPCTFEESATYQLHRCSKAGVYKGNGRVDQDISTARKSLAADNRPKLRSPGGIVFRQPDFSQGLDTSATGNDKCF